MTDLSDELIGIAEELEEELANGRDPGIQEPMNKRRWAAQEVGRSWCGSCRGGHANTYYKDFQPPPTGVRFRGVWTSRPETRDWIEREPQSVYAAIDQLVGEVDSQPALEFQSRAKEVFRRHKSAALSILDVATSGSASPYLQQLKESINNLHAYSKDELKASWLADPRLSGLVFDPKDGVFAQMQTPPHHHDLAEIQAIEVTIDVLSQLAELCRQAAEHIGRISAQRNAVGQVGTRVFIGHGRSSMWRELKDFLEDDLGLHVDEFDRVPTAGLAISERLSDMLDSAAIAFLVMTGEDHQPDGELRARENVVHEAGLFQGRLSFQRAIVLLEDGCEKFSNNAGLVHINFSKNNIRAAFEDVRKVLKREGILR